MVTHSWIHEWAQRSACLWSYWIPQWYRANCILVSGTGSTLSWGNHKICFYNWYIYSSKWSVIKIKCLAFQWHTYWLCKFREEKVWMSVYYRQQYYCRRIDFPLALAIASKCWTGKESQLFLQFLSHQIINTVPFCFRFSFSHRDNLTIINAVFSYKDGGTCRTLKSHSIWFNIQRVSGC